MLFALAVNRAVLPSYLPQEAATAPAMMWQ